MGAKLEPFKDKHGADHIFKHGYWLTYSEKWGDYVIASNQEGVEDIANHIEQLEESSWLKSRGCDEMIEAIQKFKEPS